MADDPTTQAPATADTAAGATTSAYLQLTQARVPLEDAGAAFTIRDAMGRLPIVVLPEQPFRIRNEFVIAGVIAVVLGVVLQLDNLAVRGGLVGIGVVSVFLGVFQSFIVAVPEGARALLLYDKTIGAGRHIIPPWIIVSHVVTVREIPFGALAVGVPTSDDVRVDVDLLLTFTVVAPDRFVFAISAPDFDQVCQAAAAEALRELIRSKPADALLDLAPADADRLRTAIGAAIAPYGAEVQRVVITRVRPPDEFMASREARRLAAARRDEQTEQFKLEERLQTDRDALKRQRIAAKRERIELGAANEALRLQRLEERLAAYPAASRQDVLDRRIEVAEALATNTRAMVQVGPGGDVADALILDNLVEPPGRATAAPTQARRRSGKGAGSPIDPDTPAT
jgi:regulator of protease activity HflC (stomatin/prohibitin superfamily)